MQSIDTIDTYENTKGIIALSSDPQFSVLAYPFKTKGYVRVKNYDRNLTAMINAHDSDIVAMSLNSDGTLLATASDKVRSKIIIREL